MMGAHVNEEKVTALLMNAIHDADVRYKQLQASYEQLLHDYARQKYDCIENVWKTLPHHCSFFQCLPMVDLKLLENESIVGQYVLGEILGVGQHSTIRKCTKIGSGASDMAIKIIRKEEILTVEGVFKVERELNCLRTLSNDRLPINCTEYFDSFHGRRAFYIVMEAMPIDLFDFSAYFRPYLDSPTVAVIISEITLGLHFLHSNCISHGDLKPENVLVDVRGDSLIIKLCDFGLSNHFEGDNTEVCRDFCGTTGFYCPESLTETKYCGYRSDMFSLGCVTVELLLSPSVFNEIWIGAYSKARVISLNKIAEHPDANIDFICDIKNAIENIHSKLQSLEAFCSRRCLNLILSAIRFSANARCMLDDFKSMSWLTMANLEQAVANLKSAQKTMQISNVMNASFTEEKCDKISEIFRASNQKNDYTDVRHKHVPVSLIIPRSQRCFSPRSRLVKDSSPIKALSSNTEKKSAPKSLRVAELIESENTFLLPYFTDGLSDNSSLTPITPRDKSVRCSLKQQEETLQKICKSEYRENVNNAKSPVELMTPRQAARVSPRCREVDNNSYISSLIPRCPRQEAEVLSNSVRLQKNSLPRSISPQFNDKLSPRGLSASFQKEFPSVSNTSPWMRQSMDKVIINQEDGITNRVQEKSIHDINLKSESEFLCPLLISDSLFTPFPRRKNDQNNFPDIFSLQGSSIGETHIPLFGDD